MAPREVAHRADQNRRDSFPLPPAVDDRDERREDVRLRPGAATEPRFEQLVYSTRQRVRGTRRDRSAVADENVALVVPQHELRLRQLLA
jgi:hypothetical protein